LKQVSTNAENEWFNGAEFGRLLDHPVNAKPPRSAQRQLSIGCDEFVDVECFLAVVSAQAGESSYL
jgi:hypothetical protein